MAQATVAIIALLMSWCLNPIQLNAAPKGKIASGITTQRTQEGDWFHPPIGTEIRTLDGEVLDTVSVERVQFVDSTVATYVLPLAFSPNGRRLALHGWQGGDRVWVVDDEHDNPVWVTRGQTVRREGRTTWSYNHLGTHWSPDSKRLAVVTIIDSTTMISVFEHDSLRTAYSFHHDKRADHDVPLVWGSDGSTFLVAPHSGPQRGQLLEVSDNQWKILYSSESSIDALSWDASREQLAFKSDSSVYVYRQGQVELVRTLPWFVTAIYWSPEGDWLAVVDGYRELTLLRPGGSDSWSLQDLDVGERWLIKNVSWRNNHEFAFVLVTSEPEQTSLYTGDLATRQIVRAETGDIACAPVRAVSEGFLYFKVQEYGPWQTREHRGSMNLGGDTRTVTMGLYCWEPEKGGRKQSSQAFMTMEDEHDFAAYFYPVIWISGK